MNCKINTFNTQQTILSAALILCFSPAVYAENPAAGSPEAVQQLEEVRVIGKKRITRKEKEVTGLGKIVKTADDVNKQQIINIRDLVRYEPGVSVVEQGRGGSSGFSIRGVDKNRVLVTVDGIPQIQSYADESSNSGGSGSMNEVEMENISAIEISKGSNGAEAGSGALGGSVSYYTKDVGDIIPEGKNWGITSKTVYSSRDSRKAQTLGAAARYHGFEGLVQYTHRKGSETKAHKDAGNKPQTFIRQGAYEDIYDLRGRAGLESDNLFRMEDCTGSGCVRHKAVPTLPNVTDAGSRTDPYSPEEEAQRRAMKHPSETVSANDYTGPNRIKPNPMDYKNGSWLTRFGYHFSPAHYIGVLTENTRQSYDSRDMAHSAYLPAGYELRGRPEVWQLPPDTDPRRPEFNEAGNNDGVWKNNINEGYPDLLWTQARFLKENHRKQRHGLLYRYKPQAGSSWADLLEVSLDRQNITLNTNTVLSACSRYPSADPNCRATTDKPGSFYGEERVRYGEKHWIFNTKWQRKWQLGKTTHDFQTALGFDRFDSHFNRFHEETAVFNRLQHIGKENRIINGQSRSIDIYRDLGSIANTWHRCSDWELDTCVRQPISGNSRYFALRDNIAVGKYLDLGLALRYDRYKFSSNDQSVRNKTYRKLSWNTGIAVKPTDWLTLSYRAANGFRVPSFQELYGFTVPGIRRKEKYHYIADLEPETSTNREIGLTLKGDFGNLEVSTFNSKYRNLIAWAVTGAGAGATGGTSGIGNFNLQNADLSGINIRSTIDLSGIWQKIPEGLTLHLAYNRIKAEKLFINNIKKYSRYSDYPLETIQPSRYIVGLNYDAPDGKWGTAFNWTYSKAKNPDEIISKIGFSDGTSYNKSSTTARTGSWKILDVTGYYTPRKNITLRAGIYNLFNYRYLMWETVRQTSINTLAPHKPGSDYKRYAAPGRNFTLGLEMKF